MVMAFKWEYYLMDCRRRNTSVIILPINCTDCIYYFLLPSRSPTGKAYLQPIFIGLNSEDNFIEERFLSLQYIVFGWLISLNVSYGRTIIIITITSIYYCGGEEATRWVNDSLPSISRGSHRDLSCGKWDKQ